MTDTQADLTERARAAADDVFICTNDGDTRRNVALAMVAFAQSERDRCQRISDDAMERARPVVEKWFGRPGGYDHPMLPDVAAFAQSEREAAEERLEIETGEAYERGVQSGMKLCEAAAAETGETIRAIIMRHFGLPSAGPYPGSAWQQLDPKYQRLADELIAATEDSMRPAQQLSAAKDAEIAALTADRDRWMADNKRLGQALINMNPALSQLAALTEQRDRAIAERNETRDRTYGTIRQLREQRDRAMAVVEAQANDAGLWFVAKTAPEAYLQQALRKLHAAIEGSAALDAEAAAEKGT